MNFLSDLHTHTAYSDGAHAPEAMIRAAIRLGFKSIGFSEHAPAPYDAQCQIDPQRLPEYFSEISELKKKYAESIEVYLGMESDALKVFAKEGLDYTIGSVHYLRDEATGKIYSVDYLKQEFMDAVQAIGRGDVKRLVEAFYKTSGDMLASYKPDIAGHLDSIIKLNGDGSLFDENSSWYKKELDSIAEKAAMAGCIVEINTGGICRGYRGMPYPSEYMLKTLLSLNVPLTLSSDAHSASYIGFWFKEAASLLKKLGYKSLKQFCGGVFTDVEI